MSGGEQRQRLTPAKAWLFRLTHQRNVPWILENGLHCASSTKRDPDFVPIGHPGLIDRRSETSVSHPSGGVLSDFVPFYFVPRTPMLLNILTGRGVPRQRPEDLVFLVSSFHRVRQAGCDMLFTDRAAYRTGTAYSDDPALLHGLEWHAWNDYDDRRKDDDPEAFERYQAEALVRHHVPVDALIAIGAYDDAADSKMRTAIDRSGRTLQTVTRPQWFKP